MSAPHPTPFARVLIPLDGSDFAEQAIPYASAVARSESIFIFFHVVPKMEAVYGLLGNCLLTAEQAQQGANDMAMRHLEILREQWLQRMPNIAVEIVSDDSTNGILAAAERHRADLIVMATHGRGEFDRMIIGSIADRVARSASLPVMLIHPRDASTPTPAVRTIDRLVVPLDGSEPAAQALPLVGQLASSLHIPVLLMAVSDFPSKPSTLSTYAAAFSPQVYEEVLAAGRKEAQQTLAGAANGLTAQNVAVSQKLLEGPVAKSIASVTGENDLIVMSSHGHGGFRRLFLGSVASKLINQPNLAVLLVRPTMQNA
jgi:nucleotide-binding universal stress UspA family protein